MLKRGLEQIFHSSTSSTVFYILHKSVGTNAIFDHISMQGTQHTYTVLTAFESIFLGLLLMQLSALQLLGIIPINLNKLLHGNPTGRRKREDTADGQENAELLEMILKALHTLDKYECLPRTLCEVQKYTLYNKYECPKGLRKVLHRFSKLNRSEKNSTSIKYPFGLYYAEAVETGKMATASTGRSQFYLNSTRECRSKYSMCPLDTIEILTYVHQMRLDEFTS